MRFRQVQAAALAVAAALTLAGCGVDRDVVGSYSHPDAGSIVMGDDGNGTYILFEGQTRLIAGDHQPRQPGEYLSGSTDDRSWDATYIDWSSLGEVVTITPEGGPAVQATIVDAQLPQAELVIEARNQKWSFVRAVESHDPDRGNHRHGSP